MLNAAYVLKKNFSHHLKTSAKVLIAKNLSENLLFLDLKSKVLVFRLYQRSKTDL